MLVLTRADIANVLTIDEVIEAVEIAHRSVAQGNGSEGFRAAVPLPDTDAILIPMAAALGPLRASGVKLLTDSPSNPGKGRSRQQSVVLLLDPETNGVEAILDGAELTKYRTAAASAVATRYLAREDSRTLGLIGAGALARAHLNAIRAVRPIRRVVVWSRNPSTIAGFTSEVEATGVDVIAAQSIQDITAQADIICTLTPSRTPILRGAWLEPGVHVNAVGAPPRAEYREIDTEVVRRCRVVVDSLPVALAESGAIRIALADNTIPEGHIRDELGHVIAGHVVGRHDDAELTLYNSVGLAIQDISTARLLVGIARRKGLGHDIDLTAAAEHAIANSSSDIS